MKLYTKNKCCTHHIYQLKDIVQLLFCFVFLKYCDTFGTMVYILW